MKIKYAVPIGLVNELLLTGQVQTEEDALEKVASGDALGMLLSFKQKQLADLQLAQMNTTGGGLHASNMAYEEFGREASTSRELTSLKDDIDELEKMIELRDALEE